MLGYTRGHQPRHAKVYRNFRAEYDRLQQERIAAFKEFRADVEPRRYPEEKHLVPIADGVRGVHEGAAQVGAEPMATLSIETDAPTKPRLHAESRNAGIDALRASLTLLVLFHHSAVTYGAMGSWFYQEIEPSHAPSSLILTLFAAYNQAFFMGLFFVIAGSLTPGAIARHGAAEYVRERLIRLGAPPALFRSRAGPVHGSAGADRERPFFFRDARPAREARRDHFRTDVVRLGAPDLRRLPISSCAPRSARSGSKGRGPFPSNAVLAASALATGAAAFLLRLRWPTGAEAIGLQIGYFASYVVLFAAGCLGAKGRWLETVPAANWSVGAGSPSSPP